MTALSCAFGNRFKSCEVKNAERAEFRILETIKFFIFTLQSFKYGELWQITENPPKPKIAEITGSAILPEHILHPFVTSSTALRKILKLSFKLKLLIIPEMQENVSTQADIFIIAFAPDETEFINAKSRPDVMRFSGFISFLSLKNLHKNPITRDVITVEI